MTWKDLEAPSGYHEQHGVFIRPGYKGHGPADGTGDYYEWVEYEAGQANVERLQERRERFEPPNDEPVVETAREEAEKPWQPDIDRWAILGRLDLDPEFRRRPDETWLQCAERSDQAINLTAFAQSFQQWVEAGCPKMKGR